MTQRKMMMNAYGAKGLMGRSKYVAFSGLSVQ